MKCMDKHKFEQQNVFGTGAANTAYAKLFIGQSFLNPLTDPKTGLFLANVTFVPQQLAHPPRGQGRQLVQPHCCGSSRQRLQQRMVRARYRRRVRQTERMSSR